MKLDSRPLFRALVPALAMLWAPACHRVDPGPEPTIHLEPQPLRESGPDAFSQLAQLTLLVDRLALRRPSISKMVDAQIAAMSREIQRRGRGYADVLAAGRDRLIPHDDAHSPVRRLTLAGQELAGYLPVDVRDESLARAALVPLAKTLGNDAHVARDKPYSGLRGASDFLASSEGEIAVLRLRQLGDDVRDPLRAALSRLNSQQPRPKALVIDLSRCEHGHPDVATMLVNSLAPGRLALQLAIRDKENRIARRHYAGDADWGLSGLAETPVFLTVSEDTGAMGEAVALALRMHRGATLVGRATVGLGRLVYWQVLLRDMWFGFTVADVFAADGQPIAGRAVLPDACPSWRGMQALRDRTLETYEQTCSASDGAIDIDDVLGYVVDVLKAPRQQERGPGPDLQGGEEGAHRETRRKGSLAVVGEGIPDG